MSSEEVSVSLYLIPDPKITSGHVNAESGSNSVQLQRDGTPKELLLSNDHIFSISLGPVDYPVITLRWENGLEILSSEGWSYISNKENEFLLELVEPSAPQSQMKIGFAPGVSEIGIVIVGTGELP